MKQTEHCGLNQWDPADRILRTDFNADNAKIDAALAELDGRKATRYFSSFQSVSGPNDGFSFFFQPSMAAPYSKIHVLLMGAPPTQEAQLFLRVNQNAPLYTTTAKAGFPFLRIITFFPFFNPDSPVIFQPAGFDQAGTTALDKTYQDYPVFYLVTEHENKIFPSLSIAKFYGVS